MKIKTLLICISILVFYSCEEGSEPDVIFPLAVS